MRISLSHKLIFALFGLTLLVLLATLGLARWSFERGFLDYVNALEQVRLETLGDELVNHYQQNDNSWENLTPEHFTRLAWRSMPQRAGRNSANGRDREHRPPPDKSKPPPSERGPRGRRPPPELRRAGSPTALYATDASYLVGAKLGPLNEETIRVPLTIDGSQIGELRSEPRRQLVSSQETAFSKRQATASLMIGGFSLLLALVVSMFLARGLLAPVRRMQSEVAQLSGGDYAIRLNDTRGDELGQLSRDIDRLAHTLEESRDSRKHWLANISHELRTPVTVLSGELEAIRDGVRSFDTEQLESLSQETQRLQYLIDDLYELSLSDIGGLRYEFASCNLATILKENVTLIELRAGEKNIQIDVDAIDTVIEADGQRLHQLIRNLLENSLAYTDKQGRIKVTLVNTDRNARLTIEDSPPGVSQEACERLFEPLYRQEASRSRRYGGAGLGLAICKNIVTAHGGVISASPSALGGLTIEVSLPRSTDNTLDQKGP